jgi:hypothetical protein
VCTFSNNSSNFVSVSRSFSVGLGGILGAAANREYVWNKFSVCFSRFRACCIRLVQLTDPEGADIVFGVYNVLMTAL